MTKNIPPPDPAMPKQEIQELGRTAKSLVRGTYDL
jgi:hypothetical protein